MSLPASRYDRHRSSDAADAAPQAPYWQKLADRIVVELASASGPLTVEFA